MGRKKDGWVKSSEKRAKEKQLKVQYARSSDVIAFTPKYLASSPSQITKDVKTLRSNEE
jgi:hypothetical protein